MRETSGAAWSRTTPGIWWTINDGGNGPELFAFDTAATLVGRVRVLGATNRDWEDLGAGPCAAGTGACLYIADIGDNGATADHITLYRVPEPAVGDTVTSPAEQFVARYPDGPHDAEALFVLPDGDAYVVSKGRRTPIAVFRLSTAPPARSAAGGGGAPRDVPADVSMPVLQPVRVLAPAPHSSRDRVTGAGASPDGQWIALRTSVTLEIYRRDALLTGGPPAVRTALTSLDERQGEAVALDRSGGVLLTTEGDVPRWHRLSCVLP